MPRKCSEGVAVKDQEEGGHVGESKAGLCRRTLGMGQGLKVLATGTWTSAKTTVEAMCHWSMRLHMYDTDARPNADHGK